MIYDILVCTFAYIRKRKKNEREREREREGKEEKNRGREIDSIIEYIVDRQSRDRKFIPSHVHGYRAHKTYNGDIEKYTAV